MARFTSYDARTSEWLFDYAPQLARVLIVFRDYYTTATQNAVLIHC
jgi:hypothetical protein